MSLSPEDVNVIVLDGKVHQVVARKSLFMSVHTGDIVDVAAVHPENPDEIIMTKGRGPGDVLQLPGTRFECKCGLAFNERNDKLDEKLDSRWTQAAIVDCPEC